MPVDSTQMTPFHAIVEACRKMGVPFRLLDEPPDGYTPGQAAGGCHPDKGVYLLCRDGTGGDAWAWVLHELSHVVWWHPEKGANVEERPLIAWEFAVARHYGIRGFWDCAYTAGTLIEHGTDNREVGE